MERLIILYEEQDCLVCVLLLMKTLQQDREILVITTVSRSVVQKIPSPFWNPSINIHIHKN